jgi:hypothetical protein
MAGHASASRVLDIYGHLIAPVDQTKFRSLVLAM